MRTRDGFVSNSSSTSFAVIVPRGRATIKVMIEVDLCKYADRIISNLRELDDFWEDERDGERDEQYKACRRAILRQHVIIVGGFRNQTTVDAAELLLYERTLLPKDVPQGKVLWSYRP